jgi:hypothetical protein
MRGLSGLSGFLQTAHRISQRDPSSVGFAATFSPKREKEVVPYQIRTRFSGAM